MIFYLDGRWLLESGLTNFGRDTRPTKHKRINTVTVFYVSMRSCALRTLLLGLKWRPHFNVHMASRQMEQPWWLGDVRYGCIAGSG